MELQETEEEKDEKHIRKLRENPKIKVFISSRLTAIYIIGQRKGFCRQIIPEPSCVRKGTVDIDIIIKFRND